MLYLMMSIGGGILIFRPPFVLDNLWTTTGMTKKGLTGGMRMGMNTTQIGERRVGKECRSRWSPYH